jgi:hypothetical protein
MLLSDADYLARAGVAFDVPVHPGPPPLPVGAAAIFAVAIRTYTDALADVTLYNNLRAALTRSDPHRCQLVFSQRARSLASAMSLLAPML